MGVSVSKASASFPEAIDPLVGGEQCPLSTAVLCTTNKCYLPAPKAVIIALFDELSQTFNIRSEAAGKSCTTSIGLLAHGLVGSRIRANASKYGDAVRYRAAAEARHWL
jgi:hypothetical protein